MNGSVHHGDDGAASRWSWFPLIECTGDINEKELAHLFSICICRFAHRTGKGEAILRAGRACTRNGPRAWKCSYSRAMEKSPASTR